MSCCADDGCQDGKKGDLKNIDLDLSDEDEFSEDEIVEDHKDVVKFKEQYDTRVKELKAVLEFLKSEEVGLKIIQATKYEESVDYFRGVKFHLLVLQNAEKVLALIPSFVSDGLLKQLDTTEDTLKLGQFMLYVGIVNKCTCHPGLELEKNSKAWKHSLFLAHSNNVFEYGGMYIIEKKIDKKQTTSYLILVCTLILAVVFSDHWPEWLQVGAYQAIMSYIIFFFFFYILRMVLWSIVYHAGFDFWLFPAYRSAWMPQNYLKPPFTEIKKRKNADSMGSIVWRTITGCTIIYSLFAIGIHEYTANELTTYWSAWLTNALDPNGSWQVEIDDGFREPEKTQQEKEMESDN